MPDDHPVTWGPEGICDYDSYCREEAAWTAVSRFRPDRIVQFCDDCKRRHADEYLFVPRNINRNDEAVIDYLATRGRELSHA